MLPLPVQTVLSVRQQQLGEVKAVNRERVAQVASTAMWPSTVLRVEASEPEPAVMAAWIPITTRVAAAVVVIPVVAVVHRVLAPVLQAPVAVVVRVLWRRPRRLRVGLHPQP